MNITPKIYNSNKRKTADRKVTRSKRYPKYGTTHIDLSLSTVHTKRDKSLFEWKIKVTFIRSLSLGQVPISENKLGEP